MFSQRGPDQDAGGYAFIPHMENNHPIHRNPWESFWTPLHVAVRHGQIQIIEVLLQQGARIDDLSVNYCLCERSSGDFLRPRLSLRTKHTKRCLTTVMSMGGPRLCTPIATSRTISLIICLLRALAHKSHQQQRFGVILLTSLRQPLNCHIKLASMVVGRRWLS